MLGLGILAVTSTVTPVAAQSPTRDARKQFVEGLLKSLIESQLDRGPQPPGRRSNQPDPDEKLITARKHFDSFASHSTQLVTHWNANVARAPQTRHMLGDLIKLNASVTNIQTRAANANRFDDLQPDFVALDRDWRLIAHRTKQLSGLNAECSRCISQLNQLDTTLCSLFGVTPQIDFHALVTATQAVNSSLSHLIEDIEIELPRSRQGRSLIAEVSQVQQRSLLLSDLVSQRRTYDEIVRSFQGFYSHWLNLAGKIRQVDSRHLQRTVRHVEESSHAIHELLWLQEEVDYGRLTYLSNALRRDVDGLFDAVSLNVLLDLPAGARVLPVASEFYGLCENFTNSVDAHAPLGQLKSDYRYLVDCWPELSACFTPCRTPAVTQSLQRIEISFATLRDAVGLAAAIDWHHANEVAAALTVSVESAYTAVQTYVYPNLRYDQQFRFESARAATALRSASRRLHESIIQRQSDVIAERAGAVADAWSQLNDRCFRRLASADQIRLRELCSRTTEQVVALQAMLQL